MLDTSMRRVAAAASVVLLLVCGCASSAPAAAPDVDLQLTQLPDAGFAVENRGAISIAYELSVKNRTAEAITLRRIEMRTMGDSPYHLRDAPADVEQTIAAGRDATVTFTMWAYPQEQRSNAKKIVRVNGVAQFDRVGGPVRKEFTLSFREP